METPSALRDFFTEQAELLVDAAREIQDMSVLRLLGRVYNGLMDMAERADERGAQRGERG